MMALKTRIFGEIEIPEDKIIQFSNGIIGFPKMRSFALIQDEEDTENPSGISWLQSLDEPDLALPVIDPLTIIPDYEPIIDDEFLAPLGDMSNDTTFVLVTVTVPPDIREIAVNLKAPIVINTATNQAGQLIVENDYPIKHKIYELLRSNDERKG